MTGEIMLLLALTAAAPQIPIAVGPTASVEAATRAARECGMTDIRFDPLDRERAMLLMGGANSEQALHCTLRWIHEHAREMQFEELDVGWTSEPRKD